MTEITAKDLERARKKAARRERIDQFKNDVERFYQEHKELVLIAAPIILGGAVKTINNGLHAYAVSSEQSYKDRHFYDPSNGCYVETRRKLSQRDILELDERRRRGETVTEALYNIKVLK